LRVLWRTHPFALPHPHPHLHIHDTYTLLHHHYLARGRPHGDGIATTSHRCNRPPSALMLALSQVSASSAAAHAGIISGDILIKIDGNKVIDTQHNGIVKELLGRWRFLSNNIATERIYNNTLHHYTHCDSKYCNNIFTTLITATLCCFA
jgi:hypothetical protein